MAVSVGAVAMPLESVVIVAVVTPPVNVPLAPPDAAVIVKVTLTPGNTIELLSFTVACKAVNAVLTVAVCVAPLVAKIVAGAVPVPLNVTV